MLKKILFLFTLFLVGCAHVTRVPFDSGKTIPAQKLVADFDLMRTALEDVHPGLYDFTSQEEMNRIFDGIRAELTRDMSEAEFFLLITPLNGQIGCGHTAVIPSTGMRRYISERTGLFPCDVRVVGGELFIYKCYVPEMQNPGGLKIVAINGVPAKDLMERLTDAISADGRNMTSRYERLDRQMRFYYAMLIGTPDTFEVSLSEDNMHSESNRIVELPAMAEAAIKTHPDYTRSRSNDSEPLTLEVVDGTAVMTIRTFAESDEYMTFLEHSFRKLQNEAVRKLVIDLRGNGGGEDEYGAALVAYLLDKPFRYYRSMTARLSQMEFRRHTDLTRAEFRKMREMVTTGEDGWLHVLPEHHSCLSEILPKEPGFQGRVLVMIDGGSFSATSEVAAMLHYHRRAEFVGEETGGRYTGNNSGYMTVLTLPETGIRVVLPFVKYSLAVEGYPHADRGVLPDYPVEPTIDDEIKGVDRVMMTALEL
jgi:C-terminal processing protease CtpA/Prc